MRVAVDVLPTLLGVLLLAGAAAIIVSTANSMLLSPATNLVRDVYQRFLQPGRHRHARSCFATRIAIVALGALGLVAGSFFPTVLAMALWAYTMYGAGITPALLAALVWPRATPRGRHLVDRRRACRSRLLWELAALARGQRGRAAVSVRAADDLSGAGGVGGRAGRA